MLRKFFPIVVATMLLVCSTAHAQDDVRTAKEALDKAFLKYDREISAMLEKEQDQAFNVDNLDTHAIYFGERPLTRANVNGYQAFLSEKLRLTPKQQDHLYWVERRMFSECEKLWKKYQELKGSRG